MSAALIHPCHLYCFDMLSHLHILVCNKINEIYERDIISSQCKRYTGGVFQDYSDGQSQRAPVVGDDE